MTIAAFYDPGFEAPIGRHIMPIRKFRLVANELRRHSGFRVLPPEPVEEADLLRVHTTRYVAAIKTGEPRFLAESQKFPWSQHLYRSVLLTSGGVYDAARRALDDGTAAALASGFHHACADHGEGFCTFNGLVVALEKLWAERRIETAAVLDLDLHYGNGTAQLAASRPWMFTLSIYGNDYWDNTAYRDVALRHHADGANHRSVAIPNGSDGSFLLDLLDRNLPLLLAPQRPDILLYQAGADPLRDDPYSPLDLGPSDLAQRDRVVFEFAKGGGIPIAWVLAGGYAPDISKVVEVHVNTAAACARVFQ